MVGKNVWLSFDSSPSNLCEYGTLLLVYTAAMVFKVENKESPALSVVKTLRKEMLSFLVWIKEELMYKEIFTIVQKLAFNIDAHYRKTDQDLTVIKSTVSNIRRSSSSTSLPSNFHDSRSYVNILQESISITLLLPTKSTINKKQEIIVCLDNLNQKSILRKITTNTIIKDLNVYIESLEYHSIRAIKQLPSGDIAVFIINNDMIDKLRNNHRWTLVLGSNEQIVTRTYGIMINGIQISDFNMGEKEKMIQHIKDKNKEIE